jgi:hypothetical protein
MSIETCLKFLEDIKQECTFANQEMDNMHNKLLILMNRRDNLKKIEEALKQYVEKFNK